MNSSQVRALVGVWVMLLTGMAGASDSEEDLAFWTETTAGDRAQQMAWQVAARNGRAYASPLGSLYASKETVEAPPFALPSAQAFAGHRATAAVQDGYLLGFDRGEFGGGLWWFSNDGLQRRLLDKRNVTRLHLNGRGALATVGVAHLTIDEGAILELARAADGWHVVRSIDLGSAPEADTSQGKDLILVTNKRVVRYSQGALTALHAFSARDFGTFYPNSVAVDAKGVIFVGIRHAVVRLTPDDAGYAEAWLIPGR